MPSEVVEVVLVLALVVHSEPAVAEAEARVVLVLALVAHSESAVAEVEALDVLDWPVHVPCVEEPLVEKCPVVLGPDEVLEHRIGEGPECWPRVDELELVDEPEQVDRFEQVERELVSWVEEPLVEESRVVPVPDCWPHSDLEVAEH